MCSAPQLAHRISTGCAQVLRIQFTLDIADSGADVGIDLGLTLDFFYRMNGCGVVLTAQFAGNLWKAEVQFTTQHVHGYLAGDDNVFIALGPHDIFDWYLEVAGSALNDLAGANMLGPGLGATQQAAGNAEVWFQGTHFTKR